jgi:hypothetical protein
MNEKYDTVEYLVVKCHPNVLEEKLNENGKFGWMLSTISMEQQVIEKKITSFGQNPNEIIILLVLCFYRIKKT